MTNPTNETTNAMAAGIAGAVLQLEGCASTQSKNAITVSTAQRRHNASPPTPTVSQPLIRDRRSSSTEMRSVPLVDLSSGMVFHVMVQASLDHTVPGTSP